MFVYVCEYVYTHVSVYVSECMCEYMLMSLALLVWCISFFFFFSITMIKTTGPRQVIEERVYLHL